MDSTTFIDTLVQTRAQWDALIAQIDEQWMLEPGVEGDWSIKDIIAHIMWYELEMIPLMQTRSLTGSELWDLPQDERNAAIYQQYRDYRLHEILAQEQQAYTQLLAQAKTLSDEELKDPHRFKDMPNDWTPWQILAGNSFTHYPDHIASIRTWPIRRGGGACAARRCPLPAGHGRRKRPHPTSTQPPPLQIFDDLFINECLS